jgi:acetyl esterase/lipase
MPRFPSRCHPVLESLEGRIIPRIDILNLNYAGDGLTSHLLDLHLPDNYQTGQPLPTIIWIHGGGWQSGSKSSWGPAVPFVGRGYAVASLNYRLSWEAIWPAQIHDVKGAIRWLRANADDYNLDPGRFAAWGSSAGGHLAAAAGTINGPRLEGFVGGNLDQSSRVQAVVDYYGPTDLWQIWQVPGYAGHGEAASPGSKLIGATLKLNPRKAAFASPTTFVTTDDPPTMMAHGTLTDTNGDGTPDGDGVVPWQQSEILHDSLDAAGIDNVVYYLPGVGHGGPEFTSPVMEQRVADFLAAHLPAPIPPPPPLAFAAGNPITMDQGAAADIDHWWRVWVGDDTSSLLRQRALEEGPAAWLPRQLWEPREAPVQDAKVVLLSPDGVLNQLPFVALPGNEAWVARTNRGDAVQPFDT